MNRAEHCRNPWNGNCQNTDIEVFILTRALGFLFVDAAGPESPTATSSGANP